ncbi:MAG: arginine--tRNA ligase [Candidatus Eremiobacteraeota bacterium]|nr:arginine--tRNA ligase [Candidatus Eremiobacteraeota bacterium]
MSPTAAEESLTPETALATFASGLRDAISALYSEAPETPVNFEAPRRPEFGDFATNAAFGLTRIARKSPQDIASALVAVLHERRPDIATLFAEITPTAGFINVRLAERVWHSVVADVLRLGSEYGHHEKRSTRISLEFGSANPTGPLVVVQGRTCSIGATLANAMRFCGYDVFVEWVINDAGGQLDTLARSLYARYRQLFDSSFPFPEGGYPGDYLATVAQELQSRDGDRWMNADESEWLTYFGKFGRDALVAQQLQTVERFGVHFDLWQSEKELHESGHVEKALDRLREAGTVYEKDDAVFFRATDFGDDKDRVLVKSDGKPTYLLPDVAYHYEKLQRAERVIDILGPDHHGYIGRIQGIAEALGYKGHLDVLIAQQITLMRGGEEVSMSKRAGEIITLDEIIDEVGTDAARFFFVMLSPESPLTFDLELAKQQTNDNPVYYVQYGHARIASVFKNASAEDVEAAKTGEHLAQLVHPSEIALIRRLSDMPRIVENVVDHLAPHRLARYARDVASDFHQFYTECRILTDERETRLARLALCISAKTVLAKVLNLVGVSAPDSM